MGVLIIFKFISIVIKSNFNFPRWHAPPPPSKKYKVEKLKVYLRDVYGELKEKTTWPTFKQLQKDALIVLGASIAFALVIKVMDLMFMNIMDIIY